MIDFENVRKQIAKGLSSYLSCKVIRGNQTATMPAYPYGTYNITTLASENKGTYGVYEDGKARKYLKMTMSFTTHSDDYSEAVTLASKAREWLEYAGRTVLSDNNVVIQSVGNINDRSNLLTVEYEYSYGFDCFILVCDEIQAEQINEGDIESAKIGETEYTKAADYDELNEQLENRLDGVE